MYYTELNGKVIEISVLDADAANNENNEKIKDAFEKFLDEYLEGTEEPKNNFKTFPEGQSNTKNALDTLEYMGKGMFGIFVVTVIIIVSVALLNKFTSKKKQ